MDEQFEDSNDLMNGDCFMQSAVLENSSEGSLLNAAVASDIKDLATDELPSSIMENFSQEHTPLLGTAVDTDFSCAKDVFPESLEDEKNSSQPRLQKRPPEPLTNAEDGSPEAHPPPSKKHASRRSRIAKKSLAKRTLPILDTPETSYQRRYRRYSPVYFQHCGSTMDVFAHIDAALVTKATSSVQANYADLLKQKAEEKKNRKADETVGMSAAEPASSGKQKKAKGSQKGKNSRRGSVAESVDSSKADKASSSRSRLDSPSKNDAKANSSRSRLDSPSKNDAKTSSSRSRLDSPSKNDAKASSSRSRLDSPTKNDAKTSSSRVRLDSPSKNVALPASSTPVASTPETISVKATKKSDADSKPQTVPPIEKRTEKSKGKRKAEEQLGAGTSNKKSSSKQDRSGAASSRISSSAMNALRAVAMTGAVLSIEDKTPVEVDEMFGIQSFEIRIPCLTEDEIVQLQTTASSSSTEEQKEEKDAEREEKESVKIDEAQEEEPKTEEPIKSPKCKDPSISPERKGRSKSPECKGPSKSPECKAKIDAEAASPTADEIHDAFQEKDSDESSSEREDEEKELQSEIGALNASRKDIRSSDRDCVICQRKLGECVESWRDILGPESSYCSSECIEKQVELARETVTDESTHIMMIRWTGMMLNGPSAPTPDKLLDFLNAHPDFTPVLPTVEKQAHSKEKKSSKNQKGSEKGGKSDKFLSKETDQRRLQVRRAIADKLIARAKKTANFVFTTTEVKNLAQSIEEQLFKECKQSIAGKYRTWFKQFILNVSSENNKGFYLRVLLGTISVQKLVSLDAASLSLASFSEEVEIPESRKSVKSADGEKRAKGDERDVKEKDSEKKRVRTESKGKDAATPSSTKKSSVSAVQKKKSVQKPASEVDKILGVEPKNTTDNHRYHLFDLNCDICTGKKERELLEQKKKKESEKESEAKHKKEARREEERQQVEPSTSSSWKSEAISSSNIISVVSTTTGASEDIDEGGFHMDEDDEIVSEPSKRSFQKEDSWRPPRKMESEFEDNTSKSESWRKTWKEKERSFGDSWRQDKKERHGDPFETNDATAWNGRDDERWERSERRYKDSSERVRHLWKEERKPDPRKGIEPVDLLAEEEEKPLTLWDTEERHIVWTGVLKMGLYFKFPTTLTALSNEKAFCLRKELPPVLQIIGRISPLVVFDYLTNLRRTRAKDVIVLRLDRPVNPEMEDQFKKCFVDMLNKKRYNVLEISKQKMIKDGYLIAIPRGDEPPAVLLPYDGPGIPDDHDDMIICVIVRHKDVGSSEAPPSSVSRPKKESSVLDNPPPIAIPEKPIVEIPLEPMNGGSSPGTCMREFEATLEASPLFNPSISPTMIDIHAFRSSIDLESTSDLTSSASQFESATSSRQSIPLFGSPKSEGEKLWGGLEDSPSGTEPLLPPGFFDRVQKQTPVKAPVPSITSISDLLVAIHTHTQPSEISQLVADFIERNVLQPGEQELIEKAVAQKVLVERKKRGEIVDDIDSKASSSKSKSEPEEKTDKLPSPEDDFNAKEFESGAEPSSFVGTKEALELNEIQFNKDFEPPPVTQGVAPAPKLPPYPVPKPNVPSKLDLNTSAPPPPPPPPPPPVSNPFSPSKSNIPLPPPPVPPPNPPAFVNSSSSTHVVANSQHSATPAVVMNSSSIEFPNALDSHIALEGSQDKAPESKANAGEMDMDISEDDEEDGVSSPAKKSPAVKFLPPPPPPPKFSVPLPQPPPVSNIPILTPPVPPPPPVPLPVPPPPSISTPTFFNAKPPGPFSPLVDVRKPSVPQSGSPMRPPALPSGASMRPSVPPPFLGCGGPVGPPFPATPPAFGVRTPPVMNETVFGTPHFAQKPGIMPQGPLQPQASKKPALLPSKNSAEVSTRPLNTPPNFEDSPLRPLTSDIKKIPPDPYSHSQGFGETCSRERPFPSEQRFISYETGDIDLDMEDDWDTGDYSHSDLGKKVQSFDEGKPSTSADYDEFDNGSFPTGHKEKRVYQSSQGRSPRYGLDDRRNSNAGSSGLYWGEHTDDLPEWSTTTVKRRSEPLLKGRPLGPEEGFYGVSKQEGYGNHMGPDMNRPYGESLPPLRYSPISPAGSRFCGPVALKQHIPFNGPSTEHVMPLDEASGGYYSRGGSRRGRGRGRGNYRY